MTTRHGRFPWTGFKWGDGVIPEEYAGDINHTPVFFDVDTTIFPDSYFKTGIGGEKDLEYQGVLEDILGGSTEWRPKVHHGWYFFGRHGHYMYSDGGVVDYFTSSGVDAVNSGVEGALSFPPKLGIPILARQYYRDTTNKLAVYREIQKVSQFQGRYVDGEELETWDDDTELPLWANLDRTDPEMMAYYSMDPDDEGLVSVRTFLNDNYIFDVGADPVASGSYDALRFVGTARGEANETWNLPYAPVESGSISVYVYSPLNSGTPTTTDQYNVLEGWYQATVSGNDVVVDRDLGVLHFGDGITSGCIPSGGYLIGTYYKCNVAVEYEKQWTPDHVTAWETSLDTLSKGDYRNFLVLAEGTKDPYELLLTADLPTMSPTYGPLAAGNNYANLSVEVTDENDTPVENQDVTFFFSGRQGGATLGSLSGDTSEATSNGAGLARSKLQAPTTVYELGEFVPSGDIASDPTRLFLSKIYPASGADTIYVYGVYSDDEVLGHNDPDGQLEDWITNVASGEEPYGAGGIPAQMAWERERRAVSNLDDVAEFTAGEASGRKRIISFWNPNAINPNSGELGAWVPLQPSDVTVYSSGVELSFDTTLPFTDADFEGCLVIAPALASLQAKAYNQRRNAWVYSNEIDVYLDVSESGKGVYALTPANALPSGVFPSGVILNPAIASGDIPFGFRLRSLSPMCTLAAALDQATFLDINI